MNQQMTRNWKREALAGLTTFLTISYIIVVNPSILANPATGMSFSAVLTATVLICFSMTLMMGLYAKLPFAVAPGMGINAFFTFSIIIGQKVPWATALGMVVWSGVIFLALSFSSLREKIVAALPQNLRIAISGGIGLFLAFIGLKNAGWVVADPVTFVRMGPMHSTALLALLGLFISVVFLRKKSPLAFLAGILAATIGAWSIGDIKTPSSFISAPDFSLFLQMDLWGALKLSLLPAIFSLMLTDLLDSISSFVGVSQATGLVDDKGQPLRLRQGLIVDAWATFTAGLLGSSSGTAYIESAAGIEAGGRTGLTSVFTALLFLPCLFLAPLAGMVPAYATAPVLIIVGALMFRSISKLKLESMEELIPAFLTLILIPLTFSITQGILWGIVSYTLLKTLSSSTQEKPTPMLYALSFLGLVLLWIENS